MVSDFLPNRGKTDGDSDTDSQTDEQAFVPPEALVDQEEFIDMAAGSKKPASKKPKKALRKPLALVVSLKDWWQKRTKKQQLIAAAAFGAVILLVGGFLILHKPKPAPKPAPVVKQEEKKVEPPKPTTEASRLTGVQVPPEYNQLPVTGIMIENSPDARPQSGLKDAGVVFEAVAEGGITRFLTLFQEAQPDYVGPVRSVRPYYLQWLQGFDAAVAHVGGSGEALEKIRTDGIKDLDQFYNGGAYQRITQRYAPHNVYTSLGALLSLEKSKGYTSSTFTGFTRKAEKAIVPPTVTSIDFVISGPLYNVHYDYDPDNVSYKRSEGGKPHTDERSGQQLAPKVVIALVMPQGIDPDGLHTTYSTIGSGKAYIFQDGGVTEGTWAKAADKEQFQFKDAAGAVIPLNAGQTWISVVGDVADVSYR